MQLISIFTYYVSDFLLVLSAITVAMIIGKDHGVVVIVHLVLLVLSAFTVAMIIGRDHGVVVIVHLGGEREREVLDQARMGTDTEVPGLSHGHTQAGTQGSWLHSSVPLVATGCGQGRRGAWYTMFIHSQ